MSIKSTIISLLILVSAAAASAGIFVSAQINDADVSYPIEELGGCKNQGDCKKYCDQPEHLEACLAFASQNNLMSAEEINQARKFISAKDARPGGCASKEACEAYCSNLSHIDECVSFAEKNDLLPDDKLNAARKIRAAIAAGAKPPACQDKQSCDLYCESPDHMEECVAFAEAAGFIEAEELSQAKKMLAAIKRGLKPPCQGKEACQTFCSAPENMEACTQFAIEAGFMDEKERQEAQQMITAIKNGATPPKCRGKEECQSYCSKEEHLQECAAFAQAAGIISSEEAQSAMRTKGRGPGGCQSKDECMAFCQDPENQEICFNFAKENGLAREDDIADAQESRESFQRSMPQIPPAVLECLSLKIDSETLEKIKQGRIMPSGEINLQMKTCFNELGRQMQNMRPPDGETPDGKRRMPSSDDRMRPLPPGCNSPEECKNFCGQNPEACATPDSMLRPDDFRQNPPVPRSDGSFPEPAPGQPKMLPGAPMPDFRPCEGENCQPPLMPRPESTAPENTAPQSIIPENTPESPAPAENIAPISSASLKQPAAVNQPASLLSALVKYFVGALSFVFTVL